MSKPKVDPLERVVRQILKRARDLEGVAQSGHLSHGAETATLAAAGAYRHSARLIRRAQRKAKKERTR